MCLFVNMHTPQNVVDGFGLNFQSRNHLGKGKLSINSQNIDMGCELQSGQIFFHSCTAIARSTKFGTLLHLGEGRFWGSTTPRWLRELYFIGYPMYAHSV